MSETTIGIGVGLGIPWCIFVIYLCVRAMRSNQSCCLTCSCSRKNKKENYIVEIHRQLSPLAFEDFMKGHLSSIVRKELDQLHRQNKNMDAFRIVAKDLKSPPLVIYLTDPVTYPKMVRQV